MVEDDNQMYEKLLSQVFEFWVNPEVERRGVERFNLRSAQIIFCIGSSPMVRLNEEVKVIAAAKLNKSVKKGETIFEGDIDSIEKLNLVEDEKDFGHITIVLHRGVWVISFSFNYDVTKTQMFMKIGDDFLMSAIKDMEFKNWRPMLENLSIAAENFAKARLFLLPDDIVRKSRTHQGLQGRVNIHARNETISASFKDAFNELLHTRDKARYELDFSFDESKAGKYIEVIESTKAEISRLIASVDGVPVPIPRDNKDTNA